MNHNCVTCYIYILYITCRYIYSFSQYFQVQNHFHCSLPLLCFYFTFHDRNTTLIFSIITVFLTHHFVLKCLKIVKKKINFPHGRWQHQMSSFIPSTVQNPRNIQITIRYEKEKHAIFTYKSQEQANVCCFICLFVCLPINFLTISDYPHTCELIIL